MTQEHRDYIAWIQDLATRHASPSLQPFNLLNPNPATKRSIETKTIPLLTLPTERVTPPYPSPLIMNQITISEIINQDYYAIFYPGQYSEEIGFKTKDILIIDPCYDRITSGELVLVRCETTIDIKRYFALQTPQNPLIQFKPETPNQTTLFSADDHPSFSIFGKVVFSLSKHS